MPWPISGFLPMMVTLPSAAILMNEFGTSGGPPPTTLLGDESRQRVHVVGEHHAAAGDGGDAQERTAVDCERAHDRPPVVWPAAMWMPLRIRR